MPALVAGIHVLLSLLGKDVDGRDKPGHDGDGRGYCSWSLIFSIPALTHSESTPGEPDNPAAPITSLPTLNGTPPSMAMMLGSVTCWCATEAGSRSFLGYSAGG